MLPVNLPSEIAAGLLYLHNTSGCSTEIEACSKPYSAVWTDLATMWDYLITFTVALKPQNALKVVKSRDA